MEGRPAAALPRAQRTSPSHNRRKWWLLFAAATAFILLAAALLVWALGAGKHAEQVEYSWTPESGTVTGHPDAPAQSNSDGAAMIVNANDDASPQQNPLDGAAPSPTADSAPPPSTSPAAPAAQRRTPPPARGAGAKGKGEDNLLGTLLGIIKEEDKPKASAQPPRTMDDLIAKIEADQKQRAEDERTAFDQVASKKSASTESGIQAQLRRCPGANTAQGIECRRRICAAVKGKDPACPAM